MKLSTFYKKVNKHFQTESASQFLCICTEDVRDNLLDSTQSDEKRYEYNQLADKAREEITALCREYSSITTSLPSIFELRALSTFDYVKAAILRKHAYRIFILKFLAARAKLAGN